ncbi:CinA family protein [Legionella sp. D16C41]|uniref:CinA family protein n=1 Tax=Legionella sp. D16C41 TaxID=3402688 RepID=UPI003AF9F39B
MQDLKTLLPNVTKLLQTQHKTITTAESCTGGLLASLLTELPGSSSWFERGFVTYSNLSKHEMLGVDLTLIEKYGAVSSPVAQAMVQGALVQSNADVALAVTGIAGPTGGSLEKPVGTVYLAFALKDKPPKIEHYLFANKKRQEIRILTCRQAFLGILNLLTSV